MILRSPLLRIHYYQNKRLQIKESQYFITTYSWTLTLIPNWTYSIVTISPFNARLPVCDSSIWYADPSTWLTYQLGNDVGYKVLQFIIRWRSWSSLVTKPYGVQTQQLLEEKDELGHMSLVHNMLVKNFYIAIHQLWWPLKQSLYMFRVVRKENPNIYTQIGWKSKLSKWYY